MNSRRVLALAWIAGVVLVNPFGEFPINDDWSYAAAVRSLVGEGRTGLVDSMQVQHLLHAIPGMRKTRHVEPEPFGERRNSPQALVTARFAGYIGGIGQRIFRRRQAPYLGFLAGAWSQKPRACYNQGLPEGGLS